MAEPASPPPALPELPGFDVERVLGAGGFGVVVAARRRGDGRPLAVKIARADQPGAAARLAREAEALAAVGPPWVPELVAAAPGLMVMERVEAPTLAALLVDAEPGGLLARVGPALLEAVAALHARGVVHRDLKPENIFVTERGVRLVDFGIAQVAGAAGITRTGDVIGTAEYMAPEQCAGAPAGAPADLYAAGVILFELATGRPPFFGAPADVHQGHATRRPPRPSALAPLPAALETLILRLLAKDPDQRPASAAEARQALLAALTPSDTPTVTPTPTLDPTPTPARARVPRARLFLRAAEADAGVAGAAARAAGGELAHAAGELVVIVLPDASPARAARAAEALVAQGLARAVRVHVGALAVSRRGDRVRYLSPLFARAEAYPAAGDPPGVQGIAAGDAPFVGRDGELETLLAAARRALAAGAPGLAIVIGDAGVGKSALAGELAAALPAPRVVALRAREPLAGDADETLRALLREALDLGEGGDPAAARARAGAVLGDELLDAVWPAVALTMGWIGAGDEEVRFLGAAPGVLRASVMRAAGEGLRRRARAAGGLGLIVDDAHHADAASLDALEQATAGGADPAPLFVCILAGPALARARPTLGERAPDRSDVPLGPLAAGAAAALCRELLAPAEGIPTAALERIVARTRGVPMLLVELCRGLKRDGLVRRREHGDAWYLATDEIDRLPDLPLVDWLAERDLASLPADLAAHARLVALLGGEVTRAELDGVVAGLERAGAAADLPLDPGVACRLLADRGLLLALPDGRFAFRHALVRDAMARAADPELARRVHEAAADHHAAAATPDEERLPRLAHHAAGAGRRRLACALTLDLADRARDRHAYLDAEALYSRAAALLRDGDSHGDPAAALRAHRGRALMRCRLGRWEDALADYARARELAAAEPRTEVLLMLEEATARDWQLDRDGAAALVEAARARAATLDDPRVAAQLAMGEGRRLWRLGEARRAAALLREAAARGRSLGPAGYETQVASLIMLLHLLPSIGELDEGEAVSAEVEALCAERHDSAHLVIALLNRHELTIARRQLDRALADLERAAAIARTSGLPGVLFTAELSRAYLLYCAGRLAEAERALQAADVAGRHVRAGPRATVLRTLLLAYTGRHEELARELAALDRAALMPGEDTLVRIAELASAGDAGDAGWDALRARCDPSAALELIEQRARCAQRRGAAGVAAGLLTEARALAERIGQWNLPRILRNQEELDGSPAHP